MADTPDKSTRKSFSRLFIALAVVLLIVLGAVISVRGCHNPNTREDIIDPDDPLPGAQDATGYHAVPNAAPFVLTA